LYPIRAALTRIRGLLNKSRSESELNAELSAHLEALTRENIRRGMPTEEARYAARREFGGGSSATCSRVSIALRNPQCISRSDTGGSVTALW
jgi:hypothetical protein